MAVSESPRGETAANPNFSWCSVPSASANLKAQLVSNPAFAYSTVIDIDLTPDYPATHIWCPECLQLVGCICLICTLMHLIMGGTQTRCWTHWFAI